MTAPASRAPAVELAVKTDPGRDPDKQVNEDSNTHLETKLGLLAVVCDGMGGHAGGKEASELAIKAIVEILEAAPPNANPGLALKRAIEEANARIWAMPTQEAGFRPGSTVVAVLAHEGGAEIAHVGDSRLYLIHAGAISQVTRDHSMVQEMVDRNIIRAEDAAKHPDANKILRALGIAKEVEVELRPTPLGYVNGDVFILSSDGLSDLVEPAEILDIAGSHPPKQAAAQLVDLANARGGHDNITAMVIKMKASATVNESAAAVRVAKTVPLTAVGVAPTLDGNAGPTGTALAPPIPAPSGSGPSTQIQAPIPQSSPHLPSAPAAPSIPPSRARTPSLVAGILLALAAVGIVGAIVFTLTLGGEHHKPVTIVDAEAVVATDPPLDEDAAAVETPVVPAPPLEPPPSPTPLPKWRLPDGGHRDPCAGYKHLRDRGDASAETLDRLAKACRAAGGTP
ncbi:MAG: protein phosphatase 2C domain-containing protein [Labilithrix sp.]|nr:protein phosphatase 2C domain-containing protein [Labilithrix sp.]MCW5812296.1 protein phosphatase 2C domain-containing protein [Labilithrix sp.]